MKHRLLDLVFSLLFLASCANAQVNITEEELTRIIGGSEAVEDRYSYAVYLQSSDGYSCGGSLIARDVVLTAAHCMNATDYGVAVVGSHNIIYDVDGEVLIVREVMPHPNFNPMFMKFGFLDYDIMLVFLDGASTANHVVTVKLNSDPSLPTVGQSLTVMGWGDTDARPGLDFQVTSHVLMNVDVIAISNEECEASEGYNDDGLYFSYNGKITDNMLCTEADGKDSCQGDSGGPLVIKGDDGSADVQVGVVSWAMGCALAQFPGVNTRVSQAYDWIRSEVCKGSDYASEAGFDCSINNDDDVSSTPPIIQPTSPPILAPTGGISTNDNPCIICPNGADEGFDDFAPNAVLGDPTTCAELIDDATLFETGSEDCAAAKMIELSCCYTAPENPCTICPNGVTERDDYVPPYEGNTFTCAENIDYATQFETESDYCGVFGVLDESYCCPPVNDGSSTPPIIQPTSPPILAPTGGISANDNTCIICPNGADEGFDDFTPNAVFGDPTTCAELINYATLFETETDTCGWFEIYEAFCCFTVPENPCIICPDGITEGYDDYAPYVDFGDAATCAELIDFATLFETESDYCGLIGEFDASYCCSSLDTTATAVDPCIICPNGATAGDEYSLYAATGDPTTCAELIDYAMLFETGSEDCAAAEAYELLCCLTVPENPCTICPDGTTEGFDDYVPFADEGNIFTCAETIDYAALFETESDYCGLVAEIIKLSCCYTAPENPCTICPNGATAGDDYVPEYEGNIWTCAELINEAVQYESGSDYCGLLGEEIKSYCCPYVTITPMTTPTTPNTSTAPPATDPPTVAEMTPAPTPMQTEETTDASSLGTTAMNPCIICPNGATAGDDFAPWANDGDFTTCAEHIDYATLFETGSEDCAWAEEYELLCCLTVPENPCTICPNGATAGDDYVPPYEGNTFTCAEDIDYAALFETESDYCGLFGEEIKSYCCPPETSAPTPVPVDNTTVATTTTSSTNVAPSPVEPLTTSPSSSTTTKSPTVSSSGCASVAELVFTFIVLVSSLCVIAFV